MDILPIIIKFIQMRQADFYDTRKCEKHKINSNYKKKRKKIKINFGIDIFSYIHVGIFSWIGGIRRDEEEEKNDMEMYLNKLMRESYL